MRHPGDRLPSWSRRRARGLTIVNGPSALRWVEGDEPMFVVGWHNVRCGSSEYVSTSDPEGRRAQDWACVSTRPVEISSTGATSSWACCWSRAHLSRSSWVTPGWGSPVSSLLLNRPARSWGQRRCGYLRSSPPRPDVGRSPQAAPEGPAGTRPGGGTRRPVHQDVRCAGSRSPGRVDRSSDSGAGKSGAPGRGLGAPRGSRCDPRRSCGPVRSQPDPGPGCRAGQGKHPSLA